MNADIDQSQDGGSLNVDQTQFSAEGVMAGVNDNEQGSSDPVDALNQLIANSGDVQWELLEGFQTDFRVMEMVKNGLQPDEQSHFQVWWMQHQEVISWPDFKAGGFTLADPVNKSPKTQLNSSAPAPTEPKDPVGYLSTVLARTSPFWPVSKAQMKNRPHYKDFVIENRWGKIIINGPLLSIIDENVLLVLTFIAVNTKSNNIKTSLSNLCKLLCKSRGANQYASIVQSLTRLGQVSVVIHVYDQESSVKKISSINFGSIITGNIDPDSTNIDISLNSYFLDQYLGKLSTSIHLGTRSKLHSDVAKALHRFLSTHKKFEYPFNLQTLCDAINLNTDQKTKKIRFILKKAFAELKAVGVAEFELTSDDKVYLKILP